MANSGYALGGLVDGFARGFTLMEAADQRKKDNEFREFQRGLMDAQNQRQQEQHTQNTKLNSLTISEKERDSLLKELDVDLRAMEEKGTPIDYEKYKTIGLGRIKSHEERQQLIEGGKAIQGAIETGNIDNSVLSALEQHIRPQLDERTAKDGLGRRLKGVQRAVDENGKEYYAPILEVTRPDGTIYDAPLTKNGTPDGNDPVITLDDKNIQELATALQGQGMIAELLEKSSQISPKEEAKTLRRIVFGKEKAEDENFAAVQGYDESGNPQAYIFDKKTGRHLPVGSAGLSDASGSGSGSGSGKRRGEIDVSGYLKDLQAIRVSDVFTSPEEREAARAEIANDYSIQFGVHPDVVIEAIEFYRNQGINAPMTYETIAIYQAEKERGLNQRMAELASQKDSGGQQEPVPQQEEYEPDQPAFANNENINQIAQTSFNRIVDAERNKSPANTFLAKPAVNAEAERKSIEKELVKQVGRTKAQAIMAKVDPAVAAYQKGVELQEKHNTITKQLIETDSAIQQSIEDGDTYRMHLLIERKDTLEKQGASLAKKLAESKASIANYGFVGF